MPLIKAVQEQQVMIDKKQHQMMSLEHAMEALERKYEKKFDEMEALIMQLKKDIDK
ncbi:MAG: hypothetical protein IPO92_18035 [Saprospiraceae bacterium]|nr:hypothetical protein [Saprospiraceae bacterium]